MELEYSGRVLKNQISYFMPIRPMETELSEVNLMFV